LNEDIKEFGKALAAEDDRRDGRQIPSRSHFPQGLLYREVARYAEQLERYFNVFGRNRVHIIHYDDFRDDTHREVCKTFDFLRTDPSVPISLEVMNPNKVVRHRRLHALAMTPPNRLESIYHALIPSRFHGSAAALARRVSLAYESRPPLDARVRERLAGEMAPDILRLSRLLDHDFSSWLTSQSNRDIRQEQAAAEQ
jgi:hypothetical protein